MRDYFRFDCDEVYISRQGDSIIITPSGSTWDDFFDQASAFEDDFLSERDVSAPQERDFF